MNRCIFSNCIIGFSIIFLVSVANAMPINVLSESHRVAGVSYDDTNDDAYYKSEYSSKSNSSPVSGKADLFGDGAGRAASSAGNFKVCADFEGYGWATAASDYLFTSTEDKLLLDYSGFVGFDYSDSGEVSFMLRNLTTGAILSNQLWSLPLGITGEPLPIKGSMVFSPGNDQYKLTICAKVGSGIGTDFGTSLNVDFLSDPDPAPAPVPEPVTMLLFGTGIIGCAGFKFREKKKLHLQ